MSPERPHRPLSLTCPAKLNLALAVGPADPAQHGYHPIASWMVALAFGDRLMLRRLDEQRSDYHIAFAEDAPAPQPVDWPLDNDLAVRAHRLIEAQVGRALPVDLRIDKRVPAGAGLAGGSSNAAATLVGINRLFELGLKGAQLLTLAEQLGCDTAFLTAVLCEGSNAALVTGLGQALQPLPLAEPIHLALVLPPLQCPTAAVYRRFDQLPGHRPFDRQARRVRDLAERGEPDTAGLFNDLERGALAAEPRLSALLTMLREDLDLPAHVTGSGAALFVLAEDAQAAAALARRITQHAGVPALATHTLLTQNTTSADA